MCAYMCNACAVWDVTGNATRKFSKAHNFHNDDSRLKNSLTRGISSILQTKSNEKMLKKTMRKKNSRSLILTDKKTL